LDKCARLSRPETFGQVLNESAINFAEKIWVIFGMRQSNSLQGLPESVAQVALDSWLQARYGKDCHVHVETPAGNGYADVLVEFMDDRYIVEIKVLDSTRSIGWAKKVLSNSIDTWKSMTAINHTCWCSMAARRTKARNSRR